MENKVQNSQMYNEQKSNGALTRENNNASNKSVEKV